MRNKRRQPVLPGRRAWLRAGGAQMLVSALVIDHTDSELIMLEGLTGRRPPFMAQPDFQPGRY